MWHANEYFAKSIHITSTVIILKKYLRSNLYVFSHRFTDWTFLWGLTLAFHISNLWCTKIGKCLKVTRFNFLSRKGVLIGVPDTDWISPLPIKAYSQSLKKNLFKESWNFANAFYAISCSLTYSNIIRIHPVSGNSRQLP